MGPVVALQAPYSFMLFRNQVEIEPILSKGNFVVLPGSSLDEVEVVYIPAAFVVGLMSSLCMLAIGLIWLIKVRNYQVNSYVENSKYNIFVDVFIKRMKSGLRYIGNSKKPFIHICVTLFIVALALMSLMVSLGKIHIAIQLLFMALFIVYIYKITHFITSDVDLSRGISLVIYASHLAGFVLMGIFNYYQSIKID